MSFNWLQQSPLTLIFIQTFFVLLFLSILVDIYSMSGYVNVNIFLYFSMN